MTDYDFEHLDIEIDGAVAVVRFAPVAPGDVGRSVFTNLADLFPIVGMDRAVRALVFAGGAEAFFPGAGAERTARLLAEGYNELAGQFEAQQRLVAQLVALRKPTVAAVEGPASNIGAVTALLCDAAVAAPGASFGDTHVATGIAAGDGGTVLWPLLVGMARARAIVLRGDRISAQEALDLRIVAEVVEPERLLDAAKALALQLADLPGLAYAGTKLALANWWRMGSALAWDRALGYEAAGLIGGEHLKGSGAH
jgi:enoyl-CoA hydratase